MERLEQILEGGDWACAHRERESLSLMCKLLARKEPAAAHDAREVARLARANLGEATRRWEHLGRILRAQNHLP